MENKKEITTINQVNVTGLLVKNGLEIKNEGTEKEAIAGSLVLRLEDKSEIDVNFYANRFKKDPQTKKFTTEESGLFASTQTVMEEYNGLDKEGFDESTADVITISKAQFIASDFVSKNDGKLIQATKIKGTFANRVKEEARETTPRESSFEISGVINDISDEITKQGEPTGNSIVTLNVIGYGGSIVPVRCKLLANIRDAFLNAGFYVGCCAKLTGVLVNTVEVEEYEEKQDFGEPLKKTRTITNKLYKITGGSLIGGEMDLHKLASDLTPEIYKACLERRNTHLNEVMSGTTNSASNGGMTQVPTPSDSPFGNNPFAGGVNPFQP